MSKKIRLVKNILVPNVGDKFFYQNRICKITSIGRKKLLDITSDVVINYVYNYVDYTGRYVTKKTDYICISDFKSDFKYNKSKKIIRKI